ncbi:MAG: hypothetical protein AAFP86_10235 [Planctomycetota bacterium]
MSEATESRRRARGDEPEAPQKRELETAPLLLRKASLILLIGSLFPWLTGLNFGAEMPWAAWGVGVACALAGGWIMLESAKVNAGIGGSGAVAPIANAHPLAGQIFGLLVFVGGVVGVFVLGTGNFGLYGMLECGTVLLALATFAHILGYEYGGKFNPIFPLMFAGPAVAGTLNAIKAATRIGDNGLVILSLLGSLVVAAGGIYAMYTMFVSMKQAKIEGDIKKAQERERRKQERAARRASEGQ